jgi:hypothetical protein
MIEESIAFEDMESTLTCLYERMGSWGSSTERMTKAQAIRAQNSIGKTI